MPIGFDRVCMGCNSGVARVLGRLGKVLVWSWHGFGKYPTEPGEAGEVACGLRPPHKFSRFLKTFILGVTSEVYITCIASQL